MKLNLKAAWLGAGMAAACVALPAAAAELPAFPGMFQPRLQWSSQAAEALLASGVWVTPVAPGVVSGTSVTVSLRTLQGDSVSSGYVVTGADLDGGFSWQSTPNFTNDGGSLTISQLRLDVPNSTIYARVEGANGLVTNPALALFTLESVQVNHIPKDFFILTPSSPVGPAEFSAQLKWTASGLNAVFQGLGLNATGQRVFSAVPLVGTLSFTTAVPEPSTWALSITGLALAGIYARTRRKTDAVTA